MKILPDGMKWYHWVGLAVIVLIAMKMKEEIVAVLPAKVGAVLA